MSTRGPLGPLSLQAAVHPVSTEAPVAYQVSKEAMVTLIGGEKGGTGKTALTTNLAICLQYRGFDPLIVDGDKQRTSSKFAERRGELVKLQHLPSGEMIEAIPCVEKRGEMFTMLASLKKRYTHIIVDVAGADTPQFRSALLAADLLLTPMIPSECDTDTAEELNHLVDVIRATGNAKLRALVVLNQCSTNVSLRDREIQMALDALEPFTNLPVARTYISQRSVFRRAYSARRGVIELAVNPVRDVQRMAQKATLELWKLYEEVTGDPVVKELGLDEPPVLYEVKNET